MQWRRRRFRFPPPPPLGRDSIGEYRWILAVAHSWRRLAFVAAVIREQMELGGKLDVVPACPLLPSRLRIQDERQSGERLREFFDTLGVPLATDGLEYDSLH
jgi:hypothetical protein